MTQKTFLLQIGAPKAGTTWLYSQLARHARCNMGFMKEYHIWDALTLPTELDFQLKTREAITEVRRAPWTLLKPRNTAHFYRMLRRQALYDNPDRYFRYFSRLLDNKKTDLVADITPSYCGLSEETIARIRDGFQSRGIAFKLIYLMRDPVERLWSEVRMHRQRPARDERTLRQQQMSELEHLRSRYDSPRFHVRGDYHHTLARLDALFDPSEVLVALFEELFTPATAQSIADYLDLPGFAPDSEHRVNTTVKKLDLPHELQREIAHCYGAAYRAAEKWLGHERIATHWPSLALLN